MTTALHLYLVERAETTTEFAARAGLQVATVSRIRRGIHLPSLPVARKIVAASRNMLTFDDLLKRRARSRK